MKKDTIIFANEREGFTLIEVLTVVVIISILAVIAIPQFASYRISAFNSAAQSDLRNVKSHIEAYYSEHGTYPAD